MLRCLISLVFSRGLFDGRHLLRRFFFDFLLNLLLNDGGLLVLLLWLAVLGLPDEHDGGTHGNFGYIDMTFFDALKAQVPDSCLYKQFIESMVSEDQTPTLTAEDQMRLTKVAVAAFLQHHLAGATGCEPYLLPGYYEQSDADKQEFQVSAP